jgi:S-adenosylmethionine:tRNA ribosyltransferase-isomerase
MPDNLDLAAYSYELPEELIAQFPAEKRDYSRLMVVNTARDTLEHKNFADVRDLFSAGDLLVLNDTRVFPARLYGTKATGGKVEVFLLEYPSSTGHTGGKATAAALIKSSKRPKPGAVIRINDNLECEVTGELGDGKVQLRLEYAPERDLARILAECGQVPLPPYIHRSDGTTPEDAERYQTVYARQPGAVAAPTAGLHFTRELLRDIKTKGVNSCSVTLHVGYGTFAPVREKDIRRHQIHREYVSISGETAAAVENTRKQGGKVWAVGTTSVRALEFGALKTGYLQPLQGWCDLYIYPGFRFKVIDNLITNFHLPNSSLLFLVSALCGRQTLLNCYRKAIAEGYRFFSYGDAMAIIGSQPADNIK